MKLLYSLIILLSLISTKAFSCGESAGTDMSVCENNLPLNLGASSDTFWSGDGITAEGIFNPTGPGTYVLTLHTQSSSCTDSDEKVITVLESPTVNAGTDQLICVFSEFQINATASSPNGAIVVWSWSGDDEFLSSTNIPNPVANPTGSSSFNLTVADAAGCSSFDQINLTTAPLPAVDAGSDIEMCHVTDVQNLTGLPAGGTWNGPGVTGSEFVSPGVGTHNIEYSYTDSNGCYNSDIISIEVSSLPSLDPGSMTEVCADDDVFTLDGFSPSSGVTWSGNGVVNGNIGTVDPSSLTPGVNEVTMSYGQNTCHVTDVKEIHVHGLPTISLDSEYNFCKNEENAQLSGATPTGGTWSGTPITDYTYGSIDSGLNAGSYTVTYSYTDGSTSCSNSLDAEVFIREIPEANFSANNLACLNTPLDITNNSIGNLEYTWTLDGVEQSNDNAPSISLPAEGNYVLNLQVLSEYGCFDEGVAQSIEVISEPQATFSLDNPSDCEPLQVQVTNESEGNYLTYDWDFEISNSADENPSLINYGDISEDTDYAIQLTIGNICGSSTHSETVTAIALPEADFEASLDLLCSPALVSFDNQSSANVDSYNWNLGDGESTANETPENKIYVAGSSPEDYTITLEVENSCGTSSFSQDITVLPNVVQAGFNTSELQACAPVTIDFNDESINTTGITYDFEGEQVSSLFTQRSYTEPGLYEVFQYATDGCGYDTTSVEITIYPAPVTDYNFGEDILCVGENQTFEFLGEDLSQADWVLNGNSISTADAVNHQFDNSGAYTLEFFGTTALNQCTFSNSTDLTVYDAPVIDLGSTYFSGCSPLELSLQNQAEPIGNLMSWEIGGYTTQDSAPTMSYESPGLYDIQVTAENAFGCVSELNIPNGIEVFATPEAGFDFSPDELDVLYSPEVFFENESEGATQFHWDFGDGNESLEMNPSHVYEEAGVYPVHLVVTNDDNCSDEIAMAVQVEEQVSIFIPNSFTPNNDGINEVFKPQVAGLEYLEYTFYVYDRWGQVIFKSNDIEDGWTGDVNQGDHYAAPGVYSWEIVIKFPFGHANQKYVGTVSLIR